MINEIGSSGRTYVQLKLNTRIAESKPLTRIHLSYIYETRSSASRIADCILQTKNGLQDYVGTTELSNT